MSKRSTPVKKAAPRPRKTKGYTMAKAMPKGEILTDLSKKSWCLGASIGKGGFGQIYSASEAGSKKKDAFEFALKIEPHDNGPLFVEMHFYMKNLRADDVEAFKKLRKLKHLGVPVYVGSGSCEYDGAKLRFLVLERYGKDVWSIFKERKTLLTHAVYQLSLQMLDALEYIHRRDYVHCDLKGTNILLGHKKGTTAFAYLVDFGLASRYSTGDYKPDPKKAHNGTIEYTSRDAHIGLCTRRGDLEILAYNIIHFLTGALPWETLIATQLKVQAEKEKSMGDTTTFLKKCFGKTTIPVPVLSFVNHVKSLEYKQEPDYKKCRKYFEDGLVGLGFKKDSALDFGASVENSEESAVTPRKRTRRS